MLKEITQIITRISGRRGRNCYYQLARAVLVVVRTLPEEPLMKVICAETAHICEKKAPAVWKALSRAVDDIWEYGDRAELSATLGYTPREKPSPHDFIISLACQIWCKQENLKE
ncbi:MAG: sporulation initiation factor Spo0A C-terminal domain-containing protein [Oscillospiraceae bacterium]|jgi:hypothetical protein|nr:sporulation initiation factor Spo0A C-terminal domain-containing protein [Oscillospiraceae bacterium]